MLFDQTNGQQRGGSTGVNVLLGALYFTIRLLPFEEPHRLSAVSEDQTNLLKCPQSAQIRYTDIFVIFIFRIFIVVIATVLRNCNRISSAVFINKSAIGLPY